MVKKIKKKKPLKKKSSRKLSMEERDAKRDYKNRIKEIRAKDARQKQELKLAKELDRINKKKEQLESKLGIKKPLLQQVTREIYLPSAEEPIVKPKKKQAKDCTTEAELEDLGHTLTNCKKCKKGTKVLCRWISKIRQNPVPPPKQVILDDDSDLVGLHEAEVFRCKEHSKDLALAHAGKKKAKSGKVINRLSKNGQKRHDSGMSPHGGFEMPCVHCDHLRVRAMKLGKYGRIRDYDEFMKDKRDPNADTLEERIIRQANNFHDNDEPIITFEKYPMYSRKTFSTFKNQKQRDRYDRDVKKDTKKNCKLFGEKTMFDVALNILDSDLLLRDRNNRIIKIPSNKKPTPPLPEGVAKTTKDPLTGKSIPTSEYLIKERERGEKITGYNKMSYEEKENFWGNMK